MKGVAPTPNTFEDREGWYNVDDNINALIKMNLPFHYNIRLCAPQKSKGAAAAVPATLGAQCREALGTTGPRQARAGPSIDLRDGQERHDGATRVTFSVYCDGSRVVILFDVVALRRLTPVFEAI